MNQHQKNISLVALVLIGLIASTSCGAATPRSTHLASKKSAYIPANGTPKKKAPVATADEITPSARGCTDTSGAYMVGSFIYWNSGYSDMIIAGRKQTPGDNDQKFKKISMSTEYSPGFKLGLGANFARDNWDMFLNWTWLQSNPSKSAHADSYKFATLLSNVALVQQGIFLCSEFHSSWKLQFNSLDLELGRQFYISEKLALRPHAGLKGAWIHQDLKITYEHVNANVGTGELSTPQHGKFKDHMFGVGPRLGLNTRWVLGSCNFAFLGNIAASLLWENFHPSSSIYYLDEQGLPPTITKIHGNQQQLNAVAEAFLGFDWGHCFRNGTYLNLAAGYEMQYWWDQNKTTSQIQFLQGNNSLNMHGLTTSIRLDF